jgi:thiamine biosynthesis lipoprotein
VVSAELYDLIEESIRYSELTGGAFDVTYASVGRYYDYRQSQKPDNETIDDTIPAIDYHHLTLSKAEHSIYFQHEGVYVDLGGIAKGYAVDRGIAILEDRSIDQAMISAGGDSRILGDRKGEPWVVGVKHPRAVDNDDMVAILPLTDVSVSTSGDYERYFEQDGIRYHHIIDPDTGDSARDVTSVTILGAEAVMTDALSTSVFVLGLEKGLELINKMANIDAIIVDGDGRMFLSDSLASMSELKTAGAH